MKFSGKHIELTVSALNKIPMGERVKIKDDYMSVLRIPGGFIFEYYHELEMKAAVFMSTDELRND